VVGLGETRTWVTIPDSTGTTFAVQLPVGPYEIDPWMSGFVAQLTTADV